MQDKLNINVCIVDYGMGNLRSVYNKVSSMATRPLLSSNHKDIMAADKLILPGVGQFGQGMKNLKEAGLIEVLEEKVLKQGCPILGICLGMQLFTQSSEEGEAAGLGWIDARTVKFDASQVDNPHFSVPHMGWNTIETQPDSPIYQGLSNTDELYFCHSYYVECNDASVIASRCSYGIEFTASVQKNNIYGMQFHPEKSHDKGALLIENFIALGVKEIA